MQRGADAGTEAAEQADAHRDGHLAALEETVLVEADHLLREG